MAETLLIALDGLALALRRVLDDPGVGWDMLMVPLTSGYISARRSEARSRVPTS
jgi:hypothetical protein